MTAQLPLLVFSDLDGTLIDHHSYDWSPAAPALAALKSIGAGVVLASSKTAVEIDLLRREMGLQDWPAIVENGAGVLAAHAAPQGEAAQYDALRLALTRVSPSLRQHFTGFGDMTPQDVCDATGLTREGAMLAQTRAFSEPGLWHGTEVEKTAFLAELATKGIFAQQGGRFLTLSLGATKADQVAALTQQFQPKTTVALGDAPNDIKMIEACDWGVVIANPTRPPLPPLAGEAEGRVTRTQEPGPAAWNSVMLETLARLNLN
ncbi:HAD hydrolase family protein [uncultured Tateyamaria sp.]|uniref:HAD-IIB family hydrolase n=1 Tax=uncultured Tateyamaria sp. TaxID=455651 RepID=UPI00262A6DFF|nr:HAD hydrolase family protein [uncultured Tateyamaria sp.]